MEKIYIRPSGVPLDSVKNVIDSLYREPDGTRRWAATPTFTDPELTHVECTGQRRSFEDLLTIARTYFPETTELDLMRVLVELRMYCIYCCDIKKVVFLFSHPGNGITHKVMQNFVDNSLGLYEFTDDTYSPEQLLELYNQVEVTQNV